MEKIRAGFLSDAAGAEHDMDACRVIPFLLDNPGLDWVTDNLCEVLTQRGHDSAQYPLRETMEEQPGRLPEILREHTGHCEFCLLPTTSTETVLAHAFDHVVLLVPANLDSVLTAYQRIKLLSEQDTPEIGIVLVGPRDQHAAWRFFRKLAVGTLRYLDVPLLNLGFLPEQVIPEHAPHDHHRNNFLTRISERLLRSEFYSTLPYPKAGQGSV
ncbi:MAG: MinD/ParA family protein [Thiogranum sp.]